MKIKNNEMSSFGIKEKTKEPPKHQLKPEQKHIMHDAGGPAQITIMKDTVVLMNGSNGVDVNAYGTCISGKISIGRTPEDVRVGGFWVLNDKLLTCLPSTTYTPIPVLKYSEPPVIKYAQYFANLFSSIG